MKRVSFLSKLVFKSVSYPYFEAKKSNENYNKPSIKYCHKSAIILFSLKIVTYSLPQKRTLILY